MLALVAKYDTHGIRREPGQPMKPEFFLCLDSDSIRAWLMDQLLDLVKELTLVCRERIESAM